MDNLQYEYRGMRFSDNLPMKKDEILNSFGLEGWEMVNFIRTSMGEMFYFKREIGYKSNECEHSFIVISQMPYGELSTAQICEKECQKCGELWKVKTDAGDPEKIIAKYKLIK